MPSAGLHKLATSKQLWTILLWCHDSMRLNLMRHDEAFRDLSRHVLLIRLHSGNSNRSTTSESLGLAVCNESVNPCKSTATYCNHFFCGWCPGPNNLKQSSMALPHVTTSHGLYSYTLEASWGFQTFYCHASESPWLKSWPNWNCPSSLHISHPISPWPIGCNRQQESLTYSHTSSQNWHIHRMLFYIRRVI